MDISNEIHDEMDMTIDEVNLADAVGIPDVAEAAAIVGGVDTPISSDTIIINNTFIGGGNFSFEGNVNQNIEGESTSGPITIPEFAIDNDFFDFLYAVYENEQATQEDESGRSSIETETETEASEMTETEGVSEHGICHEEAMSDTDKATRYDCEDLSSGFYHESQADSSLIRDDLLAIVENYKQRRQILDDRRLFSGSAVSNEMIKHVRDFCGCTMDSQGLIWNKDSQRKKVISKRMNTFGSYTHLYKSIGAASTEVDFHLNPTDNVLFQFDRFYTQPKLKLVHFQLRNLMTSFTHNEVYYASVKPNSDSTGLMKLNTVSGTLEEAQVDQYIDNDFTISVLTSSNDKYVAAGSFDGSLLLYFPRSGQAERYQISQESNRIINYILASKNPQFYTDLVIASNDKTLSIFDMVKGKKTNKVRFDWPINCIAENPLNSNVLLLVGDSKQSLIVDRRQSNNIPVYQFQHHHDFSFACDWNSDHLVATGNQDSTVRIYDDRNLSKPQRVLSGVYNGAVRNLKFSQGTQRQFLAFAESIDNVYLVDLNQQDKSQAYQHMHFFGKVGGLDFSQVDDRYDQELTIGVSDKSIGGIFRYRTDKFGDETGVNQMDWI
ncbi:hypothetical protein FOA43_001239 [Brettanomyces nanus]|uniref:Uncharacterized protein n=1 Tax=Eeniella nana TaxID=13502 RepID=A0A875S3Q6_EENNA|nr:uncharacterized protein FOA43_001239 [Brettanomyces nanus]QPG73924.1 hypothetical protein FOA43_001239 [Brettanomyces nanus]